MTKAAMDKGHSKSARLPREKMAGRSLTHYSVHAIAFFSGGVVLLLEILGTRIIAPYMGTSFSVWVSIIGTILGALSLGYYLGGILADRNQKLLPIILLAGACACALVHFEKPLIQDFGSLGLEWGSLLTAILLFAPPSAVLGMVSPYLIKIAADDPERIGRTSGTIYAASTIGSIAGTFLGGFFLIPHFPVSSILWGMVAVLLALSAWAAGAIRPYWAVTAGVLLTAVAIQAFTSSGEWSSYVGVSHVFEENSRYYSIRVNEIDGAERLLLLDGGINSGRDLQSDKILFPYVELSAKLIESLKPSPESVLIIGGGGYTVPEIIKQYAPQSDVTVVEIDPDVTKVARRFFLKTPDIGITNLNEDGRVFLNRNRRQFDLVYTDAYANTGAIPPHLATREAFAAMGRALKPDGVVIFNVGSARSGDLGLVYQALYRTLRDVFPTIATFSTSPDDPSDAQNLIVIATNAKSLPEDALRAFEPSRCREAPAAGLLLTDDYSPTEYLAQGIIRRIYPKERRYR